MAGLAHDAGQSAYDLFKNYPAVPDLKKVTADASGFAGAPYFGECKSP